MQQKMLQYFFHLRELISFSTFIAMKVLKGPGSSTIPFQVLQPELEFVNI